MVNKTDKSEKIIMNKHEFYFETALYKEVDLKNFEEDLFNWDVDAYSSALKDNTTYSIESSLRMFSDKTVGYRWWHSAEWVQQISLTYNRKKKEKINFNIYIYIYMMKKLL